MQKDGLKTKLLNWLQAAGGNTIPIDVIERQTKLWEYKMSNAERRLRELAEIGVIETVIRYKKDYIVGYCYKTKDTLF